MHRLPSWRVTDIHACIFTMPIASRRTFVGMGSGVLARALTASGAASPGLSAVPGPGEAPDETRYRTIEVSGLEIFYREAGPGAAPVVLALHGFPTSSRQTSRPSQRFQLVDTTTRMPIANRKTRIRHVNSRNRFQPDQEKRMHTLGGDRHSAQLEARGLKTAGALVQRWSETVHLRGRTNLSEWRRLDINLARSIAQEYPAGATARSQRQEEYFQE